VAMMSAKKALNPSRQPAYSLSLNPFTGIPFGTSPSPVPRAQQASSALPQPSPGPYQYLALTPIQSEKLWWRSFESTRIFNFQAFEVLHLELTSELTLNTCFSSDDGELSDRLSGRIKLLERIRHVNKRWAQGMKEVLDMRFNILQIMITIGDQLGLEIAILGWVCVWVFPCVSHFSISPPHA
jgi:hypothetical protein